MGGNGNAGSLPLESSPSPWSGATSLALAVGRGFSPLDDALGLLAGELTPSLVEDTVRLATGAPFGQAATLLEHFRGGVVSGGRGRRGTEGSGVAAVALQAAEAAEGERGSPAPIEGPPHLQRREDGAMVPLLQWG